MLNFIIWNVRGVNNANFRRHCTAMVKLYKTSMLILLETKMTDHKRITKTLGFGNQLQVAANGHFGAIVIIWKVDTLSIEDIFIDPQGIHAMVKVLSSSYKCLLSTIYTCTDFNSRSTL